MTVNKEYDKQAAVIDLIDVYNMIGIIPTNASKTTSYINAGTYAIKYYQTDLLSGNDVNNYEIIVSVNLVISKVKLVHTITVNKAYDGSVATVDLSEVYTMLGLSIPADHIRSTGYTNAGSHSITYNQEQLLNSADAKNYDITAIVNVNISKKVINKNITVAKEYDGSAATVDLSEVYTMVGKAAPASPTVTNYINAGSYTVSYDEATFLNGVEAKNYDVTVTVSVNISKKVINKNITIAKEYDGLAVTVDLKDVYTMIGINNPINYIETTECKNVGSYHITYDETRFLDSASAKNYDITVSVSINISKKMISDKATANAVLVDGKVIINLREIFNNPDLPASYYVTEVTTTGAHVVFITDKDLGLSSNYYIQLYLTLRVTN
jgi:hypothetical protein